ncbi:hypothetical protein XH93_05275 [Bradyrhizobium sp. CCBAU 51753]|nr:hypothetical protein XH93_05275 [Bradyrhizobium sp. CCBAU 51753]
MLVWPADTNSPTDWINVHVNAKNNEPAKNGGKPWVVGWPFKTVDEVLNCISWVKSTADFFNVWVCMSQQRDVTPRPGKAPKALRKAMNATALKAIWIDCDVKSGDPKHYDTVSDALDALDAFRGKVGLPFPSMTVNSGGGLHVYWVSDAPLSPDEWRPYAEGLKALLLRECVKCDTGLTTDIARILRVPDTFNHKYNPPRKVELLHSGAAYNFTRDLALLTKAVAVTATVTAAPPAKRGIFVPATEEGGGATFDAPDAAFGMLDATDTALQAGCERLVDPRPIFAKDGCPWLREALRTGGRDYGQPQWNLSVLCTVFMENGNTIAHEISKGHATYTQADTQGQYERKVADRRDRGVGYPSCAAIADAGSEHCKACPHQSRIKSPLHLVDFPHQTTAPNEADDPALTPCWVDPLEFSLVPEEEAIKRINAAGFFVLTSNGDIYREETDGNVVALKREGFTNLFACRNAAVGVKAVPAGQVWKTSSSRREYSQIGYWPGSHHVPHKAYNLWRGWGVQPLADDWSVINNHICTVVAGGDQKKADFILDWCAHMVQRPWEKPGVALVLRGKKGTGKTILTQLIINCIGSRNALVTANGKQLFGQFNWHLADKLLIVAEEAFFAGNHELNDRLKHLLTGEDIELEQKFGQRISMKSMHRLIMASNHDKVVDATDDERRFVVCDVPDEKRGDDAYFAPLVEIIKGRDEATLAAFMHHILTRDITHFKPERDARAAGRRDLARQKLLGLEPPLQWLLEVALADQSSSACHNLLYDVGPSDAADTWLDQTISAWIKDTTTSSVLDWPKAQALAGYRLWVKTSHVREAGEFTGAEAFWSSIKRLLNPATFPGRKLFRASGGKRFVCLPPRDELIEGFNKLLGANVVGTDEDDGS